MTYIKNINAISKHFSPISHSLHTSMLSLVTIAISTGEREPRRPSLSVRRLENVDGKPRLCCPVRPGLRAGGSLALHFPLTITSLSVSRGGGTLEHHHLHTISRGILSEILLKYY